VNTEDGSVPTSLATYTPVASLDLRVRARGPVFVQGLKRGRQDRLRPAERFFGASRWPARPAQRSQSGQSVAAGSSRVPSGSRGVLKALGRALRAREQGAARCPMALRSRRAVSCFMSPLPGGSELGSSFAFSLFGAAWCGERPVVMSSWTFARADGPVMSPSGLVDGPEVCHEVRRASTYSSPSLTRPSGRGRVEGVYGKVPGHGSGFTECGSDLRIDETRRGRVEGSREGLAAVTGLVSCPSGRGSWSSNADSSSWRRGAVSRRLASALFGALERAGSSRPSSSELGGGSEVVKRFLGGVDANPCGLADELFGALRRIGARGQAPRSVTLSWERQAFPRRFDVGRIPSKKLFGANGVEDGVQRASKRASPRFAGPPPRPSGRGGRSTERKEARGS
jgi:hypothetical protein